MEPQSATPTYTFATATGLALEACFDGGRLTSDGQCCTGSLNDGARRGQGP